MKRPKTSKQKRSRHVEKDDIINAVEQDLIKTWQDGRLAPPTSPLDAASALCLHSLLFIKGAKTFPFPPPQPSEAEFAQMLSFIADHYHLSPAFPSSNDQMNEYIASKIQEIQRKRHEPE